MKGVEHCLIGFNSRKEYSKIANNALRGDLLPERHEVIERKKGEGGEMTVSDGEGQKRKRVGHIKQRKMNDGSKWETNQEALQVRRVMTLIN
mmetsp:Transcript_3134/g.5422  ORF Transcript_3134/g.5422 Transcript_3134/m.5422 type:complete len:92 (-) Transcript_3134:858-1133(-)